MARRLGPAPRRALSVRSPPLGRSHVSPPAGTLAAHGIIAHEVERSALPDYVPNIRGSALFLMVETATPYFAVLSTGSPQLAYYDEQAH